MSTTVSPANVPADKDLYWMLWWSGLAIVGILLLVAAAMHGMSFKVGKVDFDGGLTALEAAVFYVILSFKVAPADTNAGAYCYGKALVRIPSGLHFIPCLLMQLEPRSRLVQEFQCPGEPEKVFRGHDDEPLPDGMVRPVRVVTREPKEGETSILDAQMTLIVSFVVQYVITDVFDFIANFGDSKQVEKQVRDIGEIILAEVASTTTPAGFIKKLPQTNESLITKMVDRLNHLGIKIISVRMISPDVSKAVSTALAGIPEERAKAEQVKIRAAGEEVRLTKEGVGNAAAKQAMLFAEAIGRKKMATELEVTGQEVLAAETASTLANAGTVVVGAGGGMQDLMGVVKAAQIALQPKGGTTS
ncbi:MAG: SPFH domain-containing protein [Minisyncoccota bacterium]